MVLRSMNLPVVFMHTNFCTKERSVVQRRYVKRIQLKYSVILIVFTSQLVIIVYIVYSIIIYNLLFPLVTWLRFLCTTKLFPCQFFGTNSIIRTQSPGRKLMMLHSLSHLFAGVVSPTSCLLRIHPGMLKSWKWFRFVIQKSQFFFRHIISSAGLC